MQSAPKQWARFQGGVPSSTHFDSCFAYGFRFLASGFWPALPGTHSALYSTPTTHPPSQLHATHPFFRPCSHRLPVHASMLPSIQPSIHPAMQPVKNTSMHPRSHPPLHAKHPPSPRVWAVSTRTNSLEACAYTIRVPGLKAEPQYISLSLLQCGQGEPSIHVSITATIRTRYPCTAVENGACTSIANGRRVEPWEVPNSCQAYACPSPRLSLAKAVTWQAACKPFEIDGTVPLSMHSNYFHIISSHCT